MHHWVKKHIHRSWLARISHMSSAHCNCLPLAELGVNYVPSGSKQKKTQKCTNFSTLPCWHPSALMVTQRKTSPPHPCKVLPSQQNAPVILEKKPRNQSLGQWRAEMVLNLFLQTLSVTIPYLRLFVPLRAAGTICSSECCGELCSRAHFPRGCADPEAQAPAWALPLPIPSWLCAFHTLSANLDLKSRLNHSNCSYSSSTQTNQHQHFQSRSFTLMQLVKSR